MCAPKFSNLEQVIFKKSNFIFQKFIILKQDYLKGKEAVVGFFVIFKGK